MRAARMLPWVGIAVLGAVALGSIALHRGESINAVWFVVAALSVYAVAYRFYSAWIAAGVLALDATRATPAERFDNGRDFVPTNRWVVFGHHFAAIAGPGPLIGPTLAMQFGYLPGTIWIIVGAVLGGCVQDMVIMFCSTRRNGRSLGQIARDELGPLGGWAAAVGTLMIIVILIAVLGLVIVKAMQHDPWATATVLATIPVALLVGLYMHRIRPGRVLEGTLIGIALLVACVVGGYWVDQSAAVRAAFDWDARACAWFVMLYGFSAAVLPVWLLLAPRDYLSTFLKVGVVMALAVAIVSLAPEVRMPALTAFASSGAGPIFKGDLFPFVFITIACGAVSGFHSLVASGTTPKLLANEMDVRMIGYGSMAIESFVAIMAVIAATVLDPGVYFAINVDFGKTAMETVATISSWGPQYGVTLEQMQALAAEMGLPSLFGRTGGAPSLAVGMASLFSASLGGGLMKFWYHFAIMFEVLFILTTLDAGTRVGRFMVQDFGRHFWPRFGDLSSYRMSVLASLLFVAAWGYFLWQGVTDPKGGIRFLWPMFGISNQVLAGIALAVATGVIVKMGRPRNAWITGVPLAWLAIVCTTAALQKVFSADPELGFLAGAAALAQGLADGSIPLEKAGETRLQITAFRIDAALTFMFALLLWIIILDMLRVSWRCVTGQPVPPLSESVHQASARHAAGPGLSGAA